MKVRPQKEPGLQTGLQHSTSLQQQLSKRHWSQSWNSVSCNHVAGKDVEEAAVVGNKRGYGDEEGGRPALPRTKLESVTEGQAMRFGEASALLLEPSTEV